MATLNHGLDFSGECEAAFNLLKPIFGGEFTDFQRFKDGLSDSRIAGKELE